MRSVRLAGAVAATGLLVVAVVVLGSLTPGYSHGADTISLLGSPGQPYATAANAVFVAYGTLVMVAAGLLDGVAPARGRLVSGLLAAYGAAGVVAGLAPKPAPGAPATMAGEVHVVATVLGGAAVIAAMALTAWRAPTRAERHTRTAVVVVCLGAALGFRLSWGTPVHGLLERILVGMTACHVGVLARRAQRSVQAARPRGLALPPPIRCPSPGTERRRLLARFRPSLYRGVPFSAAGEGDLVTLLDDRGPSRHPANATLTTSPPSLTLAVRPQPAQERGGT